MKRKLTVRASDGDSTIRIEAQLDTVFLTRDESASMRRELASRLMRALDGLRFTSIVLSDVRVL